MIHDTTTDDDWVKSAMDDTHLVVNLLVKLRHQSSSSSPVKSASLNLKRWSTRQRRTKQQQQQQQNVLISTNGNKTPPPRASPTTPLSSYSSDGCGGGGCTEESSLPILDGGDISRSKVIIGPTKTTPTKRPRKKRTLAELKEDETTLLKERKQLKRQLATLQATCQKQREENASLKKMKTDLQSQGLVVSEVKDCMEGKEDGGFVLPDLNFPAGEDCYY